MKLRITRKERDGTERVIYPADALPSLNLEGVSRYFATLTPVEIRSKTVKHALTTVGSYTCGGSEGSMLRVENMDWLAAYRFVALRPRVFQTDVLVPPGILAA